MTCDRCGWRWYANPKPAAAVLLERQADGDAEPSVLLLKRAVEPGFGEWDLPAGYLDPGESFEMAARRETREESGIDVELVQLCGVYHSRPANAVSAVFRARAIDSGAPVETDAESSDHAWVARSDVVDLAATHGIRLDGERPCRLGRPVGLSTALRYTRSRSMPPTTGD